MAANCHTLIVGVVLTILETSFVQGYCPDGPSSLHNGFCYHVTHSIVPSGGTAQCVALGYGPAIIETDTENQFIRTLLTESSWIGIYHLGIIGMPTWMTGGAVIYKPPGSSVSPFPAVTCYIIDSTTGSWYPDNCNLLKPFVCKMAELADPTTTSMAFGDCKDDNRMRLTALTVNPVQGSGDVLQEKVVRRLGECLELCYQVGCCSFYLHSRNMTCVTFSTDNPSWIFPAMDWAFYMLM